MPQRKRDEKPEAKEAERESLGWKIERRQKDKWVRVCPKCFDQKLRPLPSVAGILEAARYQCRACGHVGIAIEVNKQDLEELLRQQRAQSIAKDIN